MSLRPAYQSVETHIGENVCPCDKQPSLNLAVLLEQQLEFLKTPHPIKIGVSACRHNGEKAMTKDIGLIRMNRGWEIQVGGNSGRDVRVAELLYVAETSEEALELVIAFIQYYRETANYLERTGQWIDRIGLIHIREVLFERELRYQLMERLEARRFEI